jgi:phage gp46-like protein
MDIAVAYRTFSGDLDIAGGDLVSDGSLTTAVVLSLFLDARAKDDDEIPDGSSDRRGWWADAYAGQLPDSFGSRLWLLHREKQLASVLARAKEYAEEALAWLVKDGVAQSVQVTADIPRQGVLGLLVVIERPDGSRLEYLFNNLWEGV